MNKYIPFFYESIEIPLEPGDSFKHGKFKNKTSIYKSHYFDDKGDLVIVTNTGAEIKGCKIRLIKESTSVKFNFKDLGRDDWNKVLKDPDFVTEIEYMSPKEFLDRSDYKRFNYDAEKILKIKNSIDKNTTLPIPSLWFDSEWHKNSKHKSSFHDGQHRVLALQELGIEKIPVMIVWNKESKLTEEHFSPFKAWYFPDKDEFIKFSPHREHREFVDNYVDTMKSGAVRIHAFDSQVEIETKENPDNALYRKVINTLSKKIHNFKNAIDHIDWFSAKDRKVFNLQEGKKNIINENIIRNFNNQLENKYNISLFLGLNHSKEYMVLSQIIVPKENRNKGIGTKVMTEVIDFCDKYNLICGLTPSKDYGGNVKKLFSFYSRFGFKKNKYGKYSEYLVRYPIDTLEEELHLRDFKHHQATSDFTKDWIEIRRKIKGPANRSAKIKSIRVNRKKDYIIISFKSKPTYDSKAQSVDVKNMKMNGMVTAYTQEIKIEDIFAYLSTKPNYNEGTLTDKEVREALNVCPIKLSCNCPAETFQGLSYYLTQIDGAIYPNNIEPKRWNKYHDKNGDTGFVCKHLSLIGNQVEFFLTNITSMINSYLRKTNK